MLDLTLNDPFQYLDAFKRLLRTMDIELAAFSRKDLEGGVEKALENGFQKAEFLILRKPFGLLSGEKARAKVQDGVKSGRIGILVMYTFTEQEALDLMNDFLRPFGLASTELMVTDSADKNSRKVVIFTKDKGCFKFDPFFKDVGKVVIPQPHHIIVSPPAKAAIIGNNTIEANTFDDNPNNRLTGESITVCAVCDEGGKLVLVDSTIFSNDWLEKNNVFASNLLKWVGKTQ